MPYVLGGRLSEERGLYIEDHGQGEPIVLVQGLGRSMRHWLGFDRLLAESHRVITIDNRGFGRSNGLNMSPKHRVDDLASDVVSVLNALDVDRAHVVGLSLGGMIALALGYHHPSRIQSLTIINSSIAGTGKTRLSPTAGIRLALEGLSPSRRHNLLAKYLLANISLNAKREVIKQWHDIEKQEPTSLSGVLAQLWAAQRFQPEKKLPLIQNPTLVLGATDDAFVPLQNSKIIHDLIPQSQFRTIDGGGHEVTVDSPVLVRDALLDFYAAIRQQDFSTPDAEGQATKAK